ncbi:hypothetical protein ACS0TY_035063 [Phlomoides rotata]
MYQFTTMRSTPIQAVLVTPLLSRRRILSSIQDKNDSSTKCGGHEDEYQHEAPTPHNTFGLIFCYSFVV